MGTQSPETGCQHVSGRSAFSLIELLISIGIIGLLMMLTLSAVQQVRQAAARTDCQNRMRQISLAAQQHHDTYSNLPSGVSFKNTEFRYMSWLTWLLPYLEQTELHNRAIRDFSRQPIFYEPLEGHANLATPVSVFTCPLANRQVGQYSNVYKREEPYIVAFTWYQGVSGLNSVEHEGVLYRDSVMPFARITDGLSNTLLVGERPPSPDNRLGWWYAGVGQHEVGGSTDFYLGVREYPESARLPMCQLVPGSFRRGTLENICDVVHFWSLHPGGANFAFVDGSVRFLSYSANAILPALATRAGGETVVLPD
jgi:prepilin-type processing-associated H-X9-DG protein/prepilin-type N-terminal cleavage/methylation domain-containing protein